MIKTITVGPGLRISGPMDASYISKSYSNNPHMTGDVMYDLDNQCFKVYDGSSWQTYHSQQCQLELDSETQSLLAWARKKRNEEMERDLLAQTNPTVKDLISQIKEKEDQILMVQKLINSTEENPSF
jgi:hypothetical protein